MSNWVDKFSEPEQNVDDGDKKNWFLVMDEFCDVALRCQQTLPDGRYKSLVLTHLEIAASFATKAFTHGE